MLFFVIIIITYYQKVKNRIQVYAGIKYWPRMVRKNRLFCVDKRR
jgi:hypothetical protein